MPTLRFRKTLIDRLLNDARAAGEVALAFLMTAGVASCGGTQVGIGDGGEDGNNTDATEDRPIVEVARDAGGQDQVVVEAVQDGGQGDHVIVEVATDSGFDGSGGDGGFDGGGGEGGGGDGSGGDGSGGDGSTNGDGGTVVEAATDGGMGGGH